MPRVGRNPMKSAGRPYTPQKVTLVTAVHIPEIGGYWEGSLDVLKACLESVVRTTTLPYDLLVFDNGSCPVVREYLQELHRNDSIQFLLHSRHNVGKVGCWNIVFQAAPGEYIAWFDSDVLFYPGWLEKSLKVFASFENVGMVTARPGRLPVAIEDDIISATLKFADDTEPDMRVERGDLIPRSIIADHFRSIGVDANIVGYPSADVRITRGDVIVYAYASHFQFLTRRSVALQLLPLPPGARPLGADRNWDIRMNDLGLLRLALDDAYVRHLGNQLEEQSDVGRARLSLKSVAGARGLERRPKRRWITKIIPRRLLMRIYHALGSLLFPAK